LQADFIPVGSTSEILYACLVSTVAATRRTSHMPLDLIILGNLYTSQLLLI
jgi:hypothetical protein